MGNGYATQTLKVKSKMASQRMKSFTNQNELRQKHAKTRKIKKNKKHDKIKNCI